MYAKPPTVNKEFYREANELSKRFAEKREAKQNHGAQTHPIPIEVPSDPVEAKA